MEKQEAISNYTHGISLVERKNNRYNLCLDIHYLNNLLKMLFSLLFFILSSK